jgi:hypothetical protein
MRMASRILSRSTWALAALLLASCESRKQSDVSSRSIEGPSAVVDEQSAAASDPARAPAATASAGADEDPPAEAADVSADGVYENAGPPEDYGLIKTSDAPPDPSSLTLHALAGYVVVAVYDKPDMKATKLGYLRLGHRSKVTKAVQGEGCSGSWHQLPSGGYACSGRGLVVDADRPPYLHRTPPPPDESAAMPYAYAYVRKWNSPMFYRIPNREEQEEAARRRALLEAERTGEPPPGSESAAPTPKPPDAPAAREPSDATKEVEASDSLPSVTDDAAPPAEAKSDDAGAEPTTADAKPAETEPADVKPADAKPAETEPADAKPADAVAKNVEPEPIRLPLSPDKSWLERGYYLSLGDKETENGTSWWRTARNGYVEASAVAQIAGEDFEGKALDGGESFPFGWVMSKDGTKVFELDDHRKLKTTGTLERRTFVDASEETEVGGETYMITTGGQLIRKDDLRLAEPQPLPEGLQPWERWIDVDLDQQMLVAYEGTQPVFTTLVSSGRKGPPGDSYETPTGRWRIYSKHISTTMSGNTASDGTYSIQDVPWTMYFNGDFALHGAFWHQGFGRVRSHGCVNLGPTDARWLFGWTTPFVPEGWHGVHAHEGSPGTTVIVRKHDPTRGS